MVIAINTAHFSDSGRPLCDLTQSYAPVGGGGIGYTFQVGEVTDMAIRLRYLISVSADPLANQFITAL